MLMNIIAWFWFQFSVRIFSYFYPTSFLTSVLYIFYANQKSHCTMSCLVEFTHRSICHSYKRKDLGDDGSFKREIVFDLWMCLMLDIVWLWTSHDFKHHLRLWRGAEGLWHMFVDLVWCETISSVLPPLLVKWKHLFLESSISKVILHICTHQITAMRYYFCF